MYLCIVEMEMKKLHIAFDQYYFLKIIFLHKIKPDTKILKLILKSIYIFIILQIRIK